MIAKHHKCLVRVCRSAAEFDSPADLCQKHWTQWFEFDLVVAKKNGRASAYQSRRVSVKPLARLVRKLETENKKLRNVIAKTKRREAAERSAKESCIPPNRS